MIPATYNPSFYQGDSWDLQFTITQTIDNVTTAWDLTDYVVKSQMRKLASSTDVTLEFTCTKVDAINGIVVISATPTLTKAIKSGSYVWDLQLKHSVSGAVTTVVAGKVTVSSEVTRES